MNDAEKQNRFLDMEFPVEVWLAEEQVPLGELLDLQPGEVLALSREPEAAVNLMANGVIIASGELVTVDGRFGLRVTDAASRKLAQLDDSVDAVLAAEGGAQDGAQAAEEEQA